MRLSRYILFAVVSLSAVDLPLTAWAFDPVQIYVQPQFLPPQLLPPPPTEGDNVWRKQLDQVLKAQRGLPGTEIAAIKDEQRLRVELLTSVMGPTFTRENLPKTFALLDHVLNSVEQVSSADKKYWHTRRPYLTDAHVRLYVDPLDSSPSYPSGHAAGSRVLAEVIGMLVPDKLAALRARADAIGMHRVEAGVHFPNDIEAGRMLAMLVVGAILANDDFAEDLAVARKEIAATPANK